MRRDVTWVIRAQPEGYGMSRVQVRCQCWTLLHRDRQPIPAVCGYSKAYLASSTRASKTKPTLLYIFPVPVVLCTPGVQRDFTEA
jgi:hypothetical protein